MTAKIIDFTDHLIKKLNRKWWAEYNPSQRSADCGTGMPFTWEIPHWHPVNGLLYWDSVDGLLFWDEIPTFTGK